MHIGRVLIRNIDIGKSARISSKLDQITFVGEANFTVFETIETSGLFDTERECVFISDGQRLE